MQKRQYTAAFKAEVVQEALKEMQTLSQLGSLYGVHPTVIADWKAQALKSLASLFEKARSELAAEKAARERQLQELYAEIGRLTTKVSWLEEEAGIQKSGCAAEPDRVGGLGAADLGAGGAARAGSVGPVLQASSSFRRGDRDQAQDR